MIVEKLKKMSALIRSLAASKNPEEKKRHAQKIREIQEQLVEERKKRVEK